MAPGSRKRAAEDSEDFEVENTNFGASSKKVKPGAEENFMHVHSKSRVKVDANGDHYWEISKLRRVTVSSFRGKTLVNIREYYEKDGKELPGKKVGPHNMAKRYLFSIYYLISLAYVHTCANGLMLLYRVSLCQLTSSPPLSHCYQKSRPPFNNLENHFLVQTTLATRAVLGLKSLVANKKVLYLQRRILKRQARKMKVKNKCIIT